ncbi:MAG TPA: hypothetical protein VEL07_19335 [Planctomycetota bacterium]|nr:hypothetical protein [Planctomycetota bacterium]
MNIRTVLIGAATGAGAAACTSTTPQLIGVIACICVSYAIGMLDGVTTGLKANP